MEESDGTKRLLCEKRKGNGNRKEKKKEGPQKKKTGSAGSTESTGSDMLGTSD